MRDTADDLWRGMNNRIRFGKLQGAKHFASAAQIGINWQLDAQRLTNGDGARCVGRQAALVATTLCHPFAAGL